MFRYGSHPRPRTRWLALVALPLLLALAVACGDDDSPSPTAAPTDNVATAAPTDTAAAEGTPGETSTAEASTGDPLASVPGIVDASNRGWPREVEGMNGVVTLEAKPERIHTTSVGLDEVSLGLLDPSRLIAVGTSTQNPDYSNVAELVADHESVSRDPEAIAALEPDLVLVSPSQDADFVNAIASVEIPVIQVEMLHTLEGRIQSILLLGYIYGEEDRAIALAQEVQARYDALTAVTQEVPEEERKSVMLTTNDADTMRSSGAGSTEQGIILAAGGTCAPCDAGLGRNELISMESIVSISPDVIIISMAGDAAEEYRQMLLNAEVLSEVPAVRDGEVHLVPITLHNTLSYHNVRGAEQLAAMLYPELFPDEYRETPPMFSLP